MVKHQSQTVSQIKGGAPASKGASWFTMAIAMPLAAGIIYVATCGCPSPNREDLARRHDVSAQAVKEVESVCVTSCNERPGEEGPFNHQGKAFIVDLSKGDKYHKYAYFPDGGIFWEGIGNDNVRVFAKRYFWSGGNTAYLVQVTRDDGDGWVSEGMYEGRDAARVWKDAQAGKFHYGIYDAGFHPEE